jgi:hypothetical protein
MAGSQKSCTVRKIASCLALTVAAVVAQVSPAASLSLPLESPGVKVEVPTVTVKAPTVTVQTPTISVKAPPVTVHAPTVSTKAPAIPIKVPAIPTKTPAVPTKAAVPTKVPPTVSTPSPTASSNAPTVSARGSASVPGATASVPPRKAPAVSGGADAAAGRTASSAVPDSTGAAPAAPGAGGQGGAAGTSASSSGVYAGAQGAESERMPPPEIGAERGARARIAARERKLKATVARLQGCLSDLPAGQRELLELRTGAGASNPLGPRAVAARLHVGLARLALLEGQAVGELRHAASTGSCGRTAAIVAEVTSFIGAGLGEPRGTAQGGVEAARYERSARSSSGIARKSRTADSPLGIALPRGGLMMLLLLIPLLTIALTILAIFVNSTGRGPLQVYLRHGAVLGYVRRRRAGANRPRQ